MIAINIGQSEENDIVIRHNSVSRVHAVIEVDDSGDFWIIDKNSKNGVYVNNRRIARYMVDEKDQIILGAELVDSPDLFAQVKKIVDQRRTDYSIEYDSLIEKMKEYNLRKSKISEPSVWPKVVRILFAIVLIILLMFFPIDPNLKYILIVAVGIIPVILNIFFNSKHQKQEQLDLLRLEYENILLCPKCKVKLIQYSPIYIKSKGTCVNDKCKAEFKI